MIDQFGGWGGWIALAVLVLVLVACLVALAWGSLRALHAAFDEKT